MTEGQAPAAAKPRFPLVDGCRALAALSVLAYHVGEIGGGNHDGPLRYVGSCLAIGVPIFFAISGFLLYRPFASARLAGTRQPSVRGYAKRRVLRIVPAYWVALTGLALVSGWAIFNSDFWRYYGFAQIYSSRTFGGGLGVAWTLCIEVTFYALLPVYAWAVRRASLRAEVAVLVALAVASGAIRAVLGETSGYTFPASMLPGTFLWFVPGMLLAIWSVVHPERFRPEHGLRYWLVAAAAFAGVCVLGAVGAPRYLADDLLTPVIGFFVLAPAIAGAAAARTRASLPQTLLATRPLAWLGLVSYAVYLYHATLMAWLENHGAGNIFPVHWIGLAVTTLALTAAVAAASWYAIERPMLSLAGRRRRARRVRPAVAGAEPAAQPAGTAG